MSPLSTSVVVVIPTYNEAENIVSLVEEVLALPCAPQLLIVDDDSPDGTGQIADDLVVLHPGRVHVKHRTQKQGLGRAYVDGFATALALGTDLIVQMDADHSHRPQDLQVMINTAIATDADLVLGSRYIPGGSTVGWPRQRRWISRFGSWYSGAVLRVHIRDLTGGFKVWKRGLLERIDLPSITSDGYSFQIETTWRAHQQGAHIEQVPIVFHDRVAGASKLSRAVVFEAAAVVWKLRFSSR
ncbi:MAG: polyprenol monophosphomannose synthase [Thermomicrobiales bacterium]|nr:polyprenol monophosphomannose synthase [Thermomicrobiales bacterium]